MNWKSNHCTDVLVDGERNGKTVYNHFSVVCHDTNSKGQSVKWFIPPQNLIPFTIGEEVVLQKLEIFKDLNGKRATLTDWDGKQKWTVEYGEKNERRVVQTWHLKKIPIPFTIGEEVVLHGLWGLLNHDELNGKRATLMDWDKDSKKWTVKCDGDQSQYKVQTPYLRKIEKRAVKKRTSRKQRTANNHNFKAGQMVKYNNETIIAPQSTNSYRLYKVNKQFAILIKPMNGGWIVGFVDRKSEDVVEIGPISEDKLEPDTDTLTIKDERFLRRMYPGLLPRV